MVLWPFSRYKFHAFITHLQNEMQKAIVALGESAEFFANCPLRNSTLLSRPSLGFFSEAFRSEQVLAVTCNGLRRGYYTCQTSFAIKSSGRSFGILPLRISCMRILLGAISMLFCLC